MQLMLHSPISLSTWRAAGPDPHRRRREIGQRPLVGADVDLRALDPGLAFEVGGTEPRELMPASTVGEPKR